MGDSGVDPLLEHSVEAVLIVGKGAAQEKAVGDLAQSPPPAGRVELVCWIHFFSFSVFSFVVGVTAPEWERGNAR